MSTSLKTFKHSSKTHALSEHLASIAMSLGPEAKLPTIQELRRELNVSIATLDNALTQLEIQKVIYRKHGVGIFVSPHVGKKSIGLVCDPGFFRAGMSPFWQEIIEGLRAYGVSKGESCRFYLALPSVQGNFPVPDDLIEDIRNKRLDGVLFIGVNQPAVQWILDQNIPVVAFAGWSQWEVQINYPALLHLAFDAIKANHCQEIGFLTPFFVINGEQVTNPHDTIHQFNQLVAEHQLTTRPEWIWTPDRLALETTQQEQGYNAILSIFGGERTLSDGPKCIICNDDMMTRGALVAMQKLGIRVGEDLKIVTHTNKGSSVLQGYENDLWRIEVDPAAIVAAMFSLINALLEGQKPTKHTILIAPEIAKS